MFLGLPRHPHFVGRFLGVPMHPDFFESGCDDRPRRGRHHRSSKWDWKDEQRTPRGDIKYILLSLLVEQPRHGYDLIKELEARYGGFWKPSPGSVYPTLQLLEEGGYLISEPVEGKKVYTITETGRQLLAERGDPQDWMTRRNKPQQWMELGNAIADLGGLVMQVARNGNADHINRVREILNRAKREIYTILAQED
ncbi:MAG: PadR family transcriptional regulator [Hapalosiphonaceae cyanobacterium JJU2]|nr:MAG: PadR family transcriptional regulator [Hapalosiphonaceae cyanobacterium JJU2]